MLLLFFRDISSSLVLVQLVTSDKAASLVVDIIDSIEDFRLTESASDEVVSSSCCLSRWWKVLFGGAGSPLQKKFSTS